MKLKRLIIGDIHGHWNNLINIYNKEDPDEVIILGDYFDNFHGSVESIVECMNNIVELQEVHNKTKKGQFILLMGNHDFQYFMHLEKCSGYRYQYDTFAHTILNDLWDKKLIKFVHVDPVNRTIYSHAGVTNTWLKDNNMNDIEDLNFINDMQFSTFMFDSKYPSDAYGNSLHQGPLWIRPDSLNIGCYEDKSGYTWTQIVGHTNTEIPMIIKQDGYTCYTLKDAEEYKGCYHPERGEWNMIYIMDSMPNYYMIETVDMETEKILDRKIVNNKINNYEE